MLSPAIAYIISVRTFFFSSQAVNMFIELLQPYSSSHSLRSSGQNLLMVPCTLFKRRGDRSFKAVAPQLWNSLPLPLHSLDTVVTFKKRIIFSVLSPTDLSECC